jgi:hypothetical protein
MRAAKAQAEQNRESYDETRCSQSRLNCGVELLSGVVVGADVDKDLEWVFRASAPSNGTAPWGQVQSSALRRSGAPSACTNNIQFVPTL